MQTISEIDTAQICLNGHIVNLSCKNNPKANTSHCPQCGEKTITACLHCSAPIRGAAYYKRALFATSTGVCSVPKLIESEYPVPAYCHNCGAPYPWTEEMLRYGERIVEALDDLPPEKKSQLKALFPDLIVETPRSQLAVLELAKALNAVQCFGKEIFINWLSQNMAPVLYALLQSLG